MFSEQRGLILGMIRGLHDQVKLKDTSVLGLNFHPGDQNEPESKFC